MPDPFASDQFERASAALVAGAIGDALGWPNEANNRRLGRGKAASTHTGSFVKWTRRAGGRFFSHEERIEQGEYSDDTQLVIATARSLSRVGRDWFSVFTREELPAWLLYERGGGRSLKAAARSWAKGTAPWSSAAEQKRFWDAGGNGVAMRVFPHVIGAHEHVQSLRSEVLLNGLATHGHPRALAGALLYAAAGAAALRHSGSWRLGELFDAATEFASMWRDPPSHADHEGVLSFSGTMFSEEYRGTWVTTVAEVETGLRLAREAIGKGALAIDNDVLGDLGAFDRTRQGTGVTAAVVAMFLATRYAADPATGIRVAAYADGSDTDTIAAMTGALLGAMLGTSWIPPEWQAVQDRGFLNSLGRALCARPHLATATTKRLVPWTEKDTRRLRDRLASHSADGFEFGPLGKVRIINREQLRPIAKNAHAERWRLTNSEGQTVYITHISKLPVSRRDSSKDEQLAFNSVREDGAIYPGAGALADVEGLRDAVEDAIGAKELLGLMRDVVRALGARFDDRRPPEPPSWRDLVAWLRSQLDKGATNLSDAALHRLARLGWRLLYGSGAHKAPRK